MAKTCNNCPMYQAWMSSPEATTDYYDQKINNTSLVNEADERCEGPRAFADHTLMAQAVPLEEDDSKLVIARAAVSFQCENPRFYSGTM